MKKNLTRREDGSYVLKHKTKKVKKGNCIECGQNEKNRRLGLIYRYKAEDMTLGNNVCLYSRCSYIRATLVF